MASVEKRSDSQWRARWREYPGGPQRTKHFGRKVDADRHLVKVQHDLMVGAYIDPKAAQVTLRPYIATHLVRQPWRPATVSLARNAPERHVLGFFGDRPLGSIRKADVQAFVTGLDLAPATVKLVHQHLSGLLSAAAEDRLIVVNPAVGVRLPRAGAGEVVPPSAEMVRALYEAAPGWFSVAVVLGAGLGLRQAEASGLTADRVDWLAGRSVRVDRQWRSKTVEQTGFAPPKSESSIRTIPAAASVLAELAAAVERRDGFVLNRAGQPVGHHPFQHAWRQTVKRAGVERGLRFHALRHRFASVLISGGCSVVAVQRAMGHSSAAITLNLYGHLMPSDTDRIRGSLEDLFGKSPGQTAVTAK